MLKIRAAGVCRLIPYGCEVWRKKARSECAIRWGVLFPERVQDMPTTAVVEAFTVLREELRPPKYGTQLNEDASRTFYTKYLEYKRRVERANLGSAVKYQLVSMSKLVNMPAQERLAWRFFNKSSVT